ncbi:MAG: hypothetical protein AAFR81_28565 [Chloroflexota bacterium]
MIQNLGHRLESAAMVLSTGETRRMVEVEYGLSLLQTLGLENESILCLSDLLTLHELPALQHLNGDDWRRIRYARYRTPNYTSRQRWYDDLREYARLPETVQLYHVTDDVDDLRIAEINKPVDNPHHLSVFHDLLDMRPPYRSYQHHKPESGETYYFCAEPSAQRYRRHVAVELPQLDHIENPEWAQELPHKVKPDALEAFVRRRQKSKRQPIKLHWDDIVAESLLMEEKDPDRKWQSRIENIHLTAFDEEDDQQLSIDGAVHMVGMVGSGKSTLVKTILHRLTRLSDDQRMAVIVPSTIESVNFAHELNRLLGCSVDDTPVAVAYFGWSNRDKHIQAFLNEHGGDLTHTGHRWTSTNCAVMSLIHPGDISNMASPPRPGSEPCERLSDSPLEISVETDESAKKSNNQRVSCPFIADCPSRQLVRDLATARIIVTTAGGLQSRLPVFFDPRRLLLADYLYEQMDVILVDEADEVQAFEDDQFVNSVPLWNLPGALFSSSDALVSQALIRDKLNELQENWSFSLRDGAKYILPMLRMLNQSGNQPLRRWLGRAYFSAYRLFQTIARRMLGLPDWTPISEMTPKQQADYSYIRDIFSLLTARDFTKLPDPDYMPEADVARYGQTVHVQYAGKLRDILAKATTNVPGDFTLHLAHLLRNLLTKMGHDLEQNLAALEVRLQQDANEESLYRNYGDCETPESLAKKLMFALLAAGLDREMAMLVYNDDARPISITDEEWSSFNPNFRSEYQALPLAYTGPVFGTYFTPEDRDPEQQGGQRGNHENLSRVEYINPGRELLLRFHELYEPFGIHGPHIVFLSGTSYLPDSTRWHIRTPIRAVLQANPEWSKNIQDDSEYAFTPAFYRDENGQTVPVRVSGAGGNANDHHTAKEEALRQIVQHWAEQKTLEMELIDLAKRGGAWDGRVRILLLVNSYGQAEFLARRIRQYTSLSESDVQWLKPGDDESQYDGISRASIEHIAKTDLKVLVAPMLSIGRGHNILTTDKTKAAFGAVYFVVRPLNPPGDINGIAAEINHYGAKWLQDPHPDIVDKRTVREQESELRSLTLNHWHQGEKRTFYGLLLPSERRDLAATTLGRFIQAAGRLVRGGVPMIVKFIDAAWAPESAKRQAVKSYRKSDNERTSLLVAMICRLKAYTRSNDIIGQILYQPFTGLSKINGLYYNEDKCDE